MTDLHNYDLRRLLDGDPCGILLGVVNGKHVRCCCPRGHLGPHETRNGDWWS